ncbi:hypothetical protein D3C78_1219920 [compost metagenome]
MDARALGVQLLLVGELGFEAGDLAGQLRAVKVRSRSLGFGLRLGFLGPGFDFLRLWRLGGDYGLGWCRLRLHFGLGGRGRRDLVDLAVLERCDFGGLGHRFLVQGTAALLVILGQEVGLLRGFLAFEGRQGDFHGAADFFRLGNGKAHAEDQRQVHQGCQEQGKAEPIRRANAGRGEVGGDVSRQRHQVSSSREAGGKPAERVHRSKKRPA